MPSLADVEREALACTKCPLSQGRTNVVFGVGDPTSDLMLVGEGPGAQEDLQGEPFVGRSGKLLDQLVLEELGITRKEFYLANTLKCRPPGNRDPLPEEIESCRPYLEAQLDIVDPKVVITLGNFATKLLLKTHEGINRVRGRAYPFRRGWLVPTYHPAAVLRSGGESVARMRADLVRAKQLLQGVASEGGRRRATSEATTLFGGDPGGGAPRRPA
ncbi:MAG TPA: uracil-DNA glycosylase [Acidimicrobiales bacterium]|jgi:uracil-DNA glycosylase family 4|nr:uracil-DNA glycosylase [Acidimicrobiales bacterium]